MGFFSSSHFISQFPPTRFPLITAIGMCHFLPVHHLEWHFWLGRRSKYNIYIYIYFFFLPGSGCVDTAIWMHHMDAYEAAGEEAGRKLHKNVESSIKQVLATTPHETPTIRTLAPHHKNYTSSTNQTRRTLLEKQGRAHKRCTPVDPHSWMCKSGTTSTNLHTAAMWGHGL